MFMPKTLMPTKMFSDERWSVTRDALHSYTKAIGVIRSQLVPKQKHWWHISLLPCASGFTTGPIYTESQCFEVILDLFSCKVAIDFHDTTLSVNLSGQSAFNLFEEISKILLSRQIEVECDTKKISDQIYPQFNTETCIKFAISLQAIARIFQKFKNEQRKETSPVQLWPHHFDLSVLWFSGRLVPKQDPKNEEYADEQLNFGFSVGDKHSPEPYFYFTAYPLPDELHRFSLSAGASWHSDGWQGVYLPYSSLTKQPVPEESLLNLMRNFLEAGNLIMQ
jgi:uncharacterized protein DUF5996